MLSSTNLIERFHDFEWTLLAKSEEHRLYRTRYGSWVTIPTGEEKISGLLNQHNSHAFWLELESLHDEVCTLSKKGKAFQIGGLSLMGGGLVLMIIAMFNAASKPVSVRQESSTIFNILLLVLITLAPIGFWFGKNKLGPYLARAPKTVDRPLTRFEFKSPGDQGNKDARAGRA